jgi:hypothetical protein
MAVGCRLKLEDKQVSNDLPMPNWRLPARSKTTTAAGCDTAAMQKHRVLDLAGLGADQQGQLQGAQQESRTDEDLKPHLELQSQVAGQQPSSLHSKVV